MRIARQTPSVNHGTLFRPLKQPPGPFSVNAPGSITDPSDLVAPCAHWLSGLSAAQQSPCGIVGLLVPGPCSYPSSSSSQASPTASPSSSLQSSHCSISRAQCHGQHHGQHRGLRLPYATKVSPRLLKVIGC